jgi:hydrogenase nickel incorporation protein HypA/HybF
MHEFAMSEELVKAVLEEMARLKPTVILRQARVVVGALRRVTADSLRFAYEIQTRDTVAAGSSLIVDMVPVTVLCRDCGWQGALDDLLLLCRQCSGSNLQILHGMELFLSGLEVEDPEAKEK